MDAVQSILRRLRIWFVVWFVFQSIAGIAVAAYVLERLQHHGPLRYALSGGSVEITVSAGILVSMLLLLLGLLVMASLLELRPWARIVMLIVAWITAGGAVVNLLTLSGPGAWLGPAVDALGGDWQALAASSAITKAVDLAFWSWVIYTLQINPAVRGAFATQGAGRSLGPDSPLMPGP
jgi:hypothetical protein